MESENVPIPPSGCSFEIYIHTRERVETKSRRKKIAKKTSFQREKNVCVSRAQTSYTFK